MAKLHDVNTRDILDAIRLGCRTMASTFDADDNDIPFFGVTVRPEVRLSFSAGGSEGHVPGRHLNALLNAEDAAGIRIDEDAVDKHTRAAFFSYSGAVPLPLNRTEIGGPLVIFIPHNIREGFHALYPLVKYRNSARARELAEASIAAIFEYWHPVQGWNYDKLAHEKGLNIRRERTFISGVARAIGPLVKYYRATGYGPALELAIALKEKAINDVFAEDGGYDADKFGYHNHSTTCVMSSLAQLADLTCDSNLMNRVKAFYDNGLWRIRDELGWSIETSQPEDNSARGEVNNTGDILETALILGRWGYPQCYHDAERILRCHALPSQLRDVSWIEEPPNPEGVDGKRDVANRLRGAFGFPAPYGHEPVNITTSNKPRVSFNLDIVGGTVGALCEAYREVTRFEASGHWVNLLFDHETPTIEVKAPYTHPALCIRLKRSGPLFVRVPPWVEPQNITIQGVAGAIRHTNGYLFIPEPPVNREISLVYPLSTQEITLKNPDGQIRVRFRGDEVVGMDNFGADLTFFDPID